MTVTLLCLFHHLKKIKMSHSLCFVEKTNKKQTVWMRIRILWRWRSWKRINPQYCIGDISVIERCQVNQLNGSAQPRLLLALRLPSSGLETILAIAKTISKNCLLLSHILCPAVKDSSDRCKYSQECIDKWISLCKWTFKKRKIYENHYRRETFLQTFMNLWCNNV